MPAISIVMPVYNTEKYVDKAIESILNQSFTDYEFIIIDNGSQDSSGEIINKYARRDNRIRVIHNEKNVYISEARNAAISEAVGEYLYLIDSDDTAELDMLEKMYAAAKKHNAQYVVSGYFMEYYQQGKHSSYKVCPDNKFYEQEEFRKNAIKYLTRSILTVPWNKLYDLNYIKTHNIKFRNTKLEDHHFNMDMIMDIERVCMVGECFYHYNRSRPGTDSQVVYNKFLNQKKRDHFEHTLQVYEHWGISDEQTMNELYIYHSGRLVECVSETVCNKTLNSSEKKKELKEIFEDKYTLLAINNVHTHSLSLSICILPIKWKSIILCNAVGKLIGFSKKYFSNWFYKIRSLVAQKAK